ncbi:hypothetical protein C8J56DRAFT_1037443 [Mycena floridula]|nr:hypothetical protein C8J56DRAFT_1037443 [Mycena floridula]
MHRPSYSAFFSSGLLAPNCHNNVAVGSSFQNELYDTAEQTSSLESPLDNSSDIEISERPSIKASSDQPRLRHRRSSLSSPISALSAVKSPARKVVGAWTA